MLKDIYREPVEIISIPSANPTFKVQFLIFACYSCFLAVKNYIIIIISSSSSSSSSNSSITNKTKATKVDEGDLDKGDRVSDKQRKCH